MQKVRDAFKKGTKCGTWEEAEEKYSAYTTAKKLEPQLLSPEPLMKFCQLAKKPR